MNMRVPNRTLYNAAQYNLGKVLQEMYDANKMVQTGKRINSLSDDPVGLSKVLGLKSGLSNLDQLERNIITGRSWLNAGETALDSVKDLISDSKILCLSMSNGSMTDSERKDAAAQIDGTLRQILELANTKVNGQSIFAGTKTDIRPFVFDSKENPAEVSYLGNESGFKVKTGKETDMVVGHNGESVFFDSYVRIDETNNHLDFSVDNGLTQLTATLQSGRYTPEELAAEVERAMEKADSTETYTVSYDSDSRSFTITSSGSLQLLWNSGNNAATSIAPDMGYENKDDTGSTSYVSDSRVQWGIFNSLLDLKGYLENNDVEGIERSITKMDTHFEHIVGTVSDIGYKEQSLDIKEKIISDLGLGYQENRSRIEDADIFEAISSLQANETAYQASLASSSRIMRLSLVDYLKQ
ncbi:MAG TPA: flagellar hook-associated protein 3 [Desulfobacteraceae bacterium]|nr:flagellar hook-associated protein 3 [Desulfobacteraceae bacterium]